MAGRNGLEVEPRHDGPGEDAKRELENGVHEDVVGVVGQLAMYDECDDGGNQGEALRRLSDVGSMGLEVLG